jgi:hypothetical protein
MREMLIGFKADAGHLMELMLREAGVSEKRAFVVLVQPEAQERVLQALRDEGIENGWVVHLISDLGRPIDLAVTEFTTQGVRGYAYRNGQPETEQRYYPWSELTEAHIY